MSKKSSKKLLTEGHVSLKQGLHGYYLYNRHDLYVGKSIEKYGQFSDQEFRILEPWCKDGLILDIGANIGALTLPFANVGRSVIAIEPQPWVADILTANVALNAKLNVQVLRACVGNQRGEISMPVSDPNAVGNYGGTGLSGVQGNTKLLGNFPVAMIRLDDLNIQHVDVIKMDVEGFEEEALRGGEELIKRAQPVMYIEADRADKFDSLIRYIMSLGYEVLLHKPPLYERNNFYDETENVFGQIVSINAFCYIPEKHVEVNKPFKVRFQLEALC